MLPGLGAVNLTGKRVVLLRMGFQIENPEVWAHRLGNGRAKQQPNCCHLRWGRPQPRDLVEMCLEAAL